jgi:hypothetical protein
MIMKQRRNEMNRQEIIKAILDQKERAIGLGFDFPSQDPAEADTATLKSFLEELEEFLETV